MQTATIETHARMLYDELGARAIAVAARRAQAAEAGGEEESAEQWRRIEKALLSMRGPGQG